MAEDTDISTCALFSSGSIPPRPLPVWITASGRFQHATPLLPGLRQNCPQDFPWHPQPLVLLLSCLLMPPVPVFPMPSGWTLFDQTPPKCWIPAFLEILCASRHVGWKWVPRWTSKDQQGLPPSTSLQEGAVSHSQSIAPSAAVAALSLTNKIHLIPQHQFPQQLT